MSSPFEFFRSRSMFPDQGERERQPLSNDAVYEATLEGWGTRQRYPFCWVGGVRVFLDDYAAEGTGRKVFYRAQPGDRVSLRITLSDFRCAHAELVENHGCAFQPERGK